MGQLKSFRDLQVYQKLKALHIEVHRETLGFPKFEMYELGSQVRRSSNSAPALIAEGWGSRHTNMYIEAINRALGEVQAQVKVGGTFPPQMPSAFEIRPRRACPAGAKVQEAAQSAKPESSFQICARGCRFGLASRSPGFFFRLFSPELRLRRDKPAGGRLPRVRILLSLAAAPSTLTCAREVRETQHHIDVAQEKKYLSAERFQELDARYDECGRMLEGLHQSLSDWQGTTRTGMVVRATPAEYITPSSTLEQCFISTRQYEETFP